MKFQTEMAIRAALKEECAGDGDQAGRILTRIEPELDRLIEVARAERIEQDRVKREAEARSGL